MFSNKDHPVFRSCFFFFLSLIPAIALELQVSSETVPAGGMAQIKVFAVTPHAIERGSLTMEFDPAVFGEVVDVLALSASGDVIGLAELDGHRLKAQFNAFSGGVGRLPELPILTISVPVLADAPEGTTAAVTVDLTDAVWKDIQGNELTVSAMPGSVTVGGELSVHKITPRTGVAPAGTVIAIEGRGFTLSTIVEAPELIVSQVRYVNPELMELTLGAPAEMSGARLCLRNPDGPEAVVFAPVARIPDETLFQGKRIRPFFPRLTFDHVNAGLNVNRQLSSILYRTGVALENQTPTDVMVTVELFGGLGPLSHSRDTFTIASGELAIFEGERVDAFGRELYVAASVPLRMVSLHSDKTTHWELPGVPTTHDLTALVPSADGKGPIPSPSSLDWEWQVGAPAPEPKSFEFRYGTGVPTEWQVGVTTAAGGDWLSVTPAGDSNTFDVSVDPSLLSPGVYEGTITASGVGSAFWPAKVQVSLLVSSTPFLSPNPAMLRFLFRTPNEGDDTPASQTV